jgi:hypothetical protein
MYRTDKQMKMRKTIGNSQYMQDMHNNGHRDIQLTPSSVFISGNTIGTGTSNFMPMTSQGSSLTELTESM